MEGLVRTESRVSDFPAESEFRLVAKQIIKNQIIPESGSFFPILRDWFIHHLAQIIADPSTQENLLIQLTDSTGSNLLNFPSVLLFLEVIGFEIIPDAYPILLCSSLNTFNLNEAIDIFASYKDPKKLSQKEPNQQAKSEINAEVNNRRANEELVGQINDYQKQQALRYVHEDKTNKAQKDKIGNKAKVGAAGKQGNAGKIGKIGKIGNVSNSLEKNHLGRDPKGITYAKLYEDPNLDGINYHSGQAGEPKPGAVYQHDVREQEQKAFRLSNEYRARKGLQPLVWNDFIWQVAVEHSQNMALGLVPFGHDGFNDRFRRIQVVGRRKGAENVGYYYGPQEPCAANVNGWIMSPGHEKNLVGQYTYMAIGCFMNDKGFYYFTQLFALA